MENTVIKSLKEIQFLQELKNRKWNIKIYLVNGFVKKGTIQEIGDDYIIFQENGAGGKDLIFKHAISTFSENY